MPRKMESENISAAKFSHTGPLVLDAKLKGPVRHALDDNTTGTALKNIQFDPKLNEIADIGTNVEFLNESKRTTIATTETGNTVVGNENVRQTFFNLEESIMPKTARMLVKNKLFKKKREGAEEKKTTTPLPLTPPIPTALNTVVNEHAPER
ncbi:unnamed protein product [Strongylus vulgaris]|uniref:Uncharacterized protein n=1 Tax=Strongylus vulgaris TaxID=40348 RepID=A0A3P7J8X5_STRVU|nr:unnamed protein product [Strongylus vulgaris]